MNEEEIITPSFIYDVVCIDENGKQKWHEVVHNLVMTAGKTDIINKYFTGSSYTATWYLGLKAVGTAVATDTLASHSAWAEITPYSGNRPAISFGTTVSGSNTANAVSISINATASVSGAFICSASSGTSGILYSASDFSTVRAVLSGDTINITATVSVS